ncbi:TVP38/TMEM64 family protein [Pumilibacter intestinalis]|uniref:TVP38/TMEM64 family protein n=1 Tax=Pumilibacter intestinalis TaxID=2941511 RepID=UPI0020400A1F|nr:VTT domain-containing protein [Pumilibacter intestinalis]
MTKTSKITAAKVFITLLNLGMLALACVYFKDLPRVVLMCAIVIFATLGVTVPSINETQHETIYKFFVLLSVFAALLMIGYTVLDATGWLYKFKDMDTLIAIIRNTKQWGILVYIGIVIFQVIFLPIPSAIIALIGTVLYGPTYAFLFMTAGTIVGSVITFFMGKIFGRKLAVWVIGEEKTDKFAGLVNEKGRFLFIVMMLFPFFPDDIICLIAGITTMSFKYFLITISWTRPVMIAFMCYFGSGTIIPFKGWGIPVWIAIFVAVIILFFVVNKIKKKIMEKHPRPRKNRP